MAVQWLNVSFVFRINERRQRKGAGLKAEKNNTISRKKSQDYRVWVLVLLLVSFQPSAMIPKAYVM